MLSSSHSRWGLPLIAAVLALVISGCAPSPSDVPAPAPTPTVPPADEGSQEEQGPVEGETGGAADDEGALPLPAGACANSLFPLELGNQWVYAVDPPDTLLEASEPDPSDFDTFTWTVVDVAESQATLEISSEEPSFTATYTVECEDGAILTFPSVSLDLAFGGGEFGTADLEYARGSGFFLPSVETLEANNWDYNWQTELLLSGEIRTVIDDTQEFVASMQESPLVFDWSTAGIGDDAFETIDVIAGEFEALKLDLTSEMAFNIDMAGSSFTAEFTTAESQWYAPGVGLLQTVTKSAQIDLSGMSLPVAEGEGDVSLMLIEFRTGVN